MSISGDAGKKLGESIKWLFTEGGKAALTGATDLATGLGQGATDAVDIAGDALAHATDFGTNLLTGGKGTNLADKQMFLDKASDSLNENYKGVRKEVRQGLYGDGEIGTLGEAVNVVGQIASPSGVVGVATKFPKAFNAVKKVIPFIDKLDDASKSKLMTEVLDLKKSGKLTQEAVNDIAKNYSAKTVDSLKGTIAKSANAMDVKDIVAKMEPAIKQTLSEKYPKIGKILSKPEAFAEWAKANPKKAATILGSIQQIGVRLDSEMPQPDNVENAEMSLNNVESAMDQVETPNKEESTNTEPNMSKNPEVNKSEVNMSKNPVKKIGELNADAQSKNKHLNVGTSIADNMQALGINNAYEARQALYENLYGEPYTGSAEQNIKLKTKIEDYSVEEISNLIKSRSPNL